MTYLLRVLDARDVHVLAGIHRQAFPNFFLSTLGEAFLAQFYAGFLNDSSSVAIVAHDEDNQVLGAAVGTTEPSGFYIRLLKDRWRGFALASLRSVSIRPWITLRLLRALRYRGINRQAVDGAQLSSICVDPRAQGTGVGRQLLNAWVEEVGHRGVDVGALTTDASGNDAVNQFYVLNGWHLTETFRTAEGRWMNLYTIKARGVNA